MEVARQAFREGVEAFQQGAWEVARTRFALALRLRPSPLVRFNLALACRNGNHLVDALEHYRDFLRDASAEPALAERRAAAEREVVYIRAHLAWLRVDTSGDAPVRFELDGLPQSVDLVGREIPVDPGPHRILLDGSAGNRQERDGSFYEGEHVRVPVEFSRERPATAAVGSAWASRPLPMAHWTLQPGPGGRWIEWSGREVTAPRSLWEDHPVTVSILGGIGLATGPLGVSVRYFPQAWFGIEAAGGVLGSYGPGAGLYALLRVPLRAPSVYAPGLRLGASGNLAAFQIGCDPATTCNGLPATDARTVTAIWLDAAFTSEWRLLPRLPLRVSVGVRLLVNAADFRGAADHAVYNLCTDGSAGCDVYNRDPGSAGAVVAPYIAADLGYAL